MVTRDAKVIADLLKQLANENRLLLFCALMTSPLTVGELAHRVPGITQSALSQHLKLLKASGILACEKSGQRVTYSIADRRVSALMEVLKQYFCETGESS